MSSFVAGSLLSFYASGARQAAVLGTTTLFLALSGCGATRSSSSYTELEAEDSARSGLRASSATSSSPQANSETAVSQASANQAYTPVQRVSRAPKASVVHESGVRSNLVEYLGDEASLLGSLRGRIDLMSYSISCASTTVTGAGADNCSITMNGVALNPIGVSLSSSNSAVVVPAWITVARGGSVAAFTANIAAVSSAVSVKLTATTVTSSKSLMLQLNPPASTAPALSAISCASSSLTGAGSDACTVTLTAAAPSGGATVSLASNDAALVVPTSVTVPASATSVGFTATVSAVTMAQTATITAKTGSATGTFALQLSPTPTKALSVNATGISFGGVVINASATQVATLSSTGNSAVTVSSATTTGVGFSVSGVTFPLTLNAGQTATLNVQFDPTATGAVSGQLAIVSNSSTGSATSVNLSGTGEPHEVSLAWSAPASSNDPISGYHVYRATQGSSSYLLLNTTLDAQATYTDSIGQSKASYQYYVTSVDASGRESVPSNTASVTLP